MLTDDDIIDAQPTSRIHDMLVRLTHEVARLTAENEQLRAALAHYHHCPHAIPDCYCTTTAREALQGDRNA